MPPDIFKVNSIEIIFIISWFSILRWARIYSIRPTHPETDANLYQGDIAGSYDVIEAIEKSTDLWPLGIIIRNYNYFKFN